MSWMIPGLDGLRAIAFLLVFALHTNYLQMGWVGVSLFFVLSGYLITSILLNMRQTLSSRAYFFKFYGRRFLRIFPLYYFYLLVIVLLTSWLISISFRPRYMQIVLDQIWYAVFYIYNFFFSTTIFQASYFLDHFWSLSVEEQFYVFWPLLILIVPERFLKRMFISFIMLGPVFRLFFFFLHNSGIFRFLVDDPALALYPLAFSHIDAFAFGAYISRFQIPKARQQFFLLIGLIPILGFVTEYIATGRIGDISAFGYPLLLQNAYKFIWAYSLLNYFFTVIIYGVVQDGWFTGFLEWRPLRYLGKISYGLYVYHFPVIWFSGRISDLGIAQHFVQPLSALIALLVTILIASLSFQFIERPITNLKDRLFPIKAMASGEKSTSMIVEKTTPA
jgi:peptidoglycan/LPS O-acetylase OafA/YrhL